MTKEEIKALINAKLAGQGNQVDLGSALPTILNEIVDMAGGESLIYEFSDEESAQLSAQGLPCSHELYLKLSNIVLGVKIKIIETSFIFPKLTYIDSNIASDMPDYKIDCVFGFMDSNNDEGKVIYYNANDHKLYFKER